MWKGKKLRTANTILEENKLGGLTSAAFKSTELQRSRQYSAGERETHRSMEQNGTPRGATHLQQTKL